LLSPVIFGYFAVIMNELKWLQLPSQFLIIGSCVLPFTSIFYMVLLRVFRLAPQELSEAALLLGADEEQSMMTAYGPFYLVGIFYSLLLCGCYLFSVQGFGFMGTQGFLSTLLYNYLYLPGGWQMNAVYGFVVLMVSMVGFILVQLFVPILDLLPAISGRGGHKAGYKRLESSMPLIGFLFYSEMLKTGRRKNKSKEKAAKEEVEKAAETEAATEEATV
jgi:hypothetical protein